jgi:tetratricopeptide (TPR) repeat protein
MRGWSRNWGPLQYLLSRHERNKATPEGATKALEYARQAIQKDPAYATAFAALADSYNSLGHGAQIPYREAFSRAKAAATRALEIDEALPEAHTALAEAVSNLDWDWPGAGREFKRALELNPNSAAAHQGYACYHVNLGSSPEGIEHAKRAVDLDPLSPRRHLALFFAYYFARHFDRALEPLREAAALDSEFDPRFFLGWIHREKGMFAESIAELEKAASQAARRVHTLGHLGNAYARAGRVRDARECLQELKARAERDTVGAFEVALVYTGLGEKDQAFEWLRKAYDGRDKGLVSSKVDPPLDPLRSDPRFQDLLRRMKFPP